MWLSDPWTGCIIAYSWTTSCKHIHVVVLVNKVYRSSGPCTSLIDVRYWILYMYHSAWAFERHCHENRSRPRLGYGHTRALHVHAGYGYTASYTVPTAPSVSITRWRCFSNSFTEGRRPKGNKLFIHWPQVVLLASTTLYQVVMFTRIYKAMRCWRILKQGQ